MKQKIIVQILNHSRNDCPKYMTDNSSGVDLQANITKSYFILPLERRLIPTGLFVAIPEGYEAQIRPRSGLALKKGITVLNTPGTVDSDYRGEIGVIIINLSNDVFEVNPGDRIAQMVFTPYVEAEFDLVEELPESKREGGFGSTGK